MSDRKIPFVNGEIYHIFNRGTDKRKVFLDNFDIERFFQSMLIFNSQKATGGIHEKSFELMFKGHLRGKTSELIDIYNANSSDHIVEFIMYCLNPNHFHFVLKQVADDGISRLMQKIGGYTYYFNKKYKRSGSLFQGKFKSVFVENNTQLLHLSAYVNLNNQLRGKTSKLSKSSWDEYVNGKIKGVCKKDIILEQFSSLMEYKKFALSSLEDINQRKELEKILLEHIV